MAPLSDSWASRPGRNHPYQSKPWPGGSPYRAYGVGVTHMEDHNAGRIAPSQGLRLLAIHAHPDDESSKGSATMAAYVAAGARVMVASCTGGERGDILNAAVGELAHAHRDLAGVRRREMAEAAAVLGIEHRWIGFVDSGLPEG